MIEGKDSARIEAWGPLKLLLWGYVAPDVGTACIVYLSMYWSMILSFVSNLIILVFMQGLIPLGFMYTSIFAVSVSIFFSVWKALQNRHRFTSMPFSKIILSFFLLPLGLFGAYLLSLTVLKFDPSDGYLSLFALFCLLVPVVVVPVVSFTAGLIASNILRIFKAEKNE